jgi:cytoskeleton protein RodZ
MSQEPGGEPIRSIGARLRAAREQRGLTVLQAAEKLHVDARVLESLEGDDFAALGAPVYVRGHLRRYAELTGESSEQLQDLYAASAHPTRPDLTRIPHGEPRERPSVLMLPVLLTVVGVAFAGLIWWAMKLPSEKAQPVPATPPASLSGQTAPQQDAAESPQTPAPAATTPAPAAPSGSVRPGEAQMGLSFSAPSWVEVTDADGRRLLSGLIEAHGTRTLAGPAPMRVTLGNAPAVALSINGRPVALEGLVRHDGSAHLTIDNAGRASIAPPRLAHGD